MAILDIFKRKKPKKKKEAKKPAAAKALAGKEVKKTPEVKVERKPSKIKKEVKLETLPKSKKISEFRAKRSFNIAYRNLKTPHVTEKAGDLTQRNQYVFKIWPRANKIEIKKAIQDIYGVDVLNVRIIKIPKKARRLGRQKGWREGYKKAIIKIKEGQKIEVLPR